MKKVTNTDFREVSGTREFKNNLNYHLASVSDGSITIVKQDGYPIQFNICEKYKCGEYLC